MRIARTCTFAADLSAPPHTTVSPSVIASVTWSYGTETDFTEDLIGAGSSLSTAAASATDWFPRSEAAGWDVWKTGNLAGRDATQRTTTPYESTRSKPPPGADTA